ncbi:unnamed protein product [Brachionus calyciflorus]|uniref:Uncharacterized protein n=1 Tax=Brachionus calyciflorus TaxID=104777 RepID=A0A814FQ12_9BILA|nr:unnamed protein product [Brachionus calyciflorus]
MSKILPKREQNSDELTQKKALDLLDDHVNHGCCTKSKNLQDIKITNLAKKLAYSYHVIHFKMNYEPFWEVNYTEGDDSKWDNEAILNVTKEDKLKAFAGEFARSLRPKEYFKNETRQIIVPNSGIYYKCENCKGSGFNLTPKYSCSFCQESNILTDGTETSFVCKKCNQTNKINHVECNLCKKGQIRKILKIKINYKSVNDIFYFNKESVPSDFFQKTKGKQIFYEEKIDGRVKPLSDFSLKEMNEKSQQVIQSNEGVIAQKHYVISYPVWKCDYTVGDYSFFLVGEERFVYAPQYKSSVCTIV